MINAGLVSEGRRLSHALGVPAGAVVIGTAAESAETYRQLGASPVYLLKSAALAAYRCEVFAYALAAFTRRSAPRLLLMAHSDCGKELAPRIAFHLDTAAVTGCADIMVKNGDLSYTRPVHGFQFVEQVSFAPGLVEIATILTEALDCRVAPKSAAPEPLPPPRASPRNAHRAHPGNSGGSPPRYRRPPRTPKRPASKRRNPSPSSR